MKKKTLSFQIRAEELTEEREFTGLALPFDTPTEIIPGWYEQFRRGSIQMPEKTLPLFRDHTNPIGIVLAIWETEVGLMIRARIANTPLGDETYELMKAGALNSLSICFTENEYQDEKTSTGNLRTQLNVTLHEISVVSFPAYKETEIQEIRNQQGETEMPNAYTQDENIKEIRESDDMREIRSKIDTIQRDVDALITGARNTATAVVVDTRSIGEILKAINADDKETIETLNKREFTGAKSTDDASFDLMPAAIKDLTRIVQKANPLSQMFTPQPLPPTGNTISYLELESETVEVKEIGEADSLTFGKLKVKDEKSARIKQHAGGVALSRYVIDRSPINILNRHMQALAIEAGNHAEAVLTNWFKENVTARDAAAVTTSGTLAALTWTEFKDHVIDVVVKMKKAGLKPNRLLVDLPTFKAITSWKDSTGAPLVKVFGDGVNQVGQFQVEHMKANVLIDIYPDFNAETEDYYGENVIGVFLDTEAVGYYASKIVDLSQSDISNLTDAFAVYWYDVVVLEIVDGFIPLKVQG